MPHSSRREEDFVTLKNFIHYLEHTLPNDEQYIYRNDQICEPGLFIMTFNKLIVGEFSVLKRLDSCLNRSDYNYEYEVKPNSIKIYDYPVQFYDFKQKIQLKASSTNYRPIINKDDYQTLLKMTQVSK